MQRKHWHLTSDPSDRGEYGGRVSQRKYADHLAKWARRQVGHPIYVMPCTGDCAPAGQPLTTSEGPVGRPLIEVLADD